MYTLKIKWMRVEHGDLADETTLFIAADEVRVHGVVTPEHLDTHWPAGSYQDYRSSSVSTPPEAKVPETTYSEARLICVGRDGRDTFYVASHAWLMGPNGDTIERLA